MKKFITILLSVLLLSIGLIVPSYAQETVSVDIPITTNTPSTVEITGDSNLPEQTTFEVTNEYLCKLTFDKIGTYKYQIKEIPKEDNYIYDTRVYNVEVLVVNEDGLKTYISISVEGSETKEEKVAFANVEKDNRVPILVTKVSDEDEPLEGARLVLINDADSAEIEKWETTKDSKEFLLNDGSYTIHEELAPNGFDKVEDFSFTITEGKISLTENDNVKLEENNIIIKDPKIVVPPTPEPKPTKTGDDTHLLLYVISLIGSIALITVILVRRRKNGKN